MEPAAEHEDARREPKTFKLNVQGVLTTWHAPIVVAREAIVAAGFSAEDEWIIILKIAGREKQAITLDTKIDLRTPGLEKLRLTPKQINNGEGPGLRREFRLLPKDEIWLGAYPGAWETVVDAARRWVLLHGYPLPEGYVQRQTTLAIEVPTTYPGGELDMFYCNPHLALATGRAIDCANHYEAIEGSPFQRWSRHRPPGAWSPLNDNLVTHLSLVDEALVREVEQ